MIDLSESNKGWKRFFIHVTSSNGFGVNLKWRTSDVGGNQGLGVMPEEQKDFDKLLKCKFPWKLVLDEGEIDNYWPKIDPLNVDPSATAPNDFNLQTGEPD